MVLSLLRYAERHKTLVVRLLRLASCSDSPRVFSLLAPESRLTPCAASSVVLGRLPLRICYAYSAFSGCSTVSSSPSTHIGPMSVGSAPTKRSLSASGPTVLATEREPIEVTVDIDGEEVLVGLLRVHQRRGQSVTFQYDESYLTNARAYPLDPSLQLGGGVFSPASGQTLFGALADSSPDRWGQALMRRSERSRAQAAGTQARTLGGPDFLLGVRDELRQGAIRFRCINSDEHLGADDDGVPAVVNLPRLLAASDELDQSGPDGQDLKDLIAAGSSLGGARPKAAVRLNDGSLGIAKFPRKGYDNWDIPLWEMVEASLAARSGITMSDCRLDDVAGRNVFIASRFDRAGDRRIGFVSAMTLLEATDGVHRSYLEIAEVIEIYSDTPSEDLEELFRRIVFSVLTGNTDDHLRNHGFLRRGSGWQLSPAYDLNPNPDSPVNRSTDLDSDGLVATVANLLSVSEYFRVATDRAKELVGEIEAATSEWRSVAKAYGAKLADVSLMELAYDNEQRSEARRLAVE